MAIEWDVTVTPINVSEQIIKITGVRTDTTDPDNPITVSLSPETVATGPQKADVLDRLHAMAQQRLALTATIATMESDAKTYLENK